MFIARNWWTPLLADAFFSIGLPLGVLGSLLTIVVTVFIVYMMPMTDRRRQRLNTLILSLTIVMVTLIFDILYGRGLPRVPLQLTLTPHAGEMRIPRNTLRATLQIGKRCSVPS